MPVTLPILLLLVLVALPDESWLGLAAPDSVLGLPMDESQAVAPADRRPSDKVKFTAKFKPDQKHEVLVRRLELDSPLSKTITVSDWMQLMAKVATTKNMDSKAKREWFNQVFDAFKEMNDKTRKQERRAKENERLLRKLTESLTGTELDDVDFMENELPGDPNEEEEEEVEELEHKLQEEMGNKEKDKEKKGKKKKPKKDKKEDKKSTKKESKKEAKKETKKEPKKRGGRDYMGSRLNLPDDDDKEEPDNVKNKQVSTKDAKDTKSADESKPKDVDRVAISGKDKKEDKGKDKKEAGKDKEEDEDEDEEDEEEKDDKDGKDKKDGKGKKDAKDEEEEEEEDDDHDLKESDPDEEYYLPKILATKEQKSQLELRYVPTFGKFNFTVSTSDQPANSSASSSPREASTASEGKDNPNRSSGKAETNSTSSQAKDVIGGNSKLSQSKANTTSTDILRGNLSASETKTLTGGNVTAAARGNSSTASGVALGGNTTRPLSSSNGTQAIASRPAAKEAPYEKMSLSKASPREDASGDNDALPMSTNYSSAASQDSADSSSYNDKTADAVGHAQKLTAGDSDADTSPANSKSSRALSGRKIPETRTNRTTVSEAEELMPKTGGGSILPSRVGGQAKEKGEKARGAEGRTTASHQQANFQPKLTATPTGRGMSSGNLSMVSGSTARTKTESGRRRLRRRRRRRS